MKDSLGPAFYLQTVCATVKRFTPASSFSSLGEMGRCNRSDCGSFPMVEPQACDRRSAKAWALTMGKDFLGVIVLAGGLADARVKAGHRAKTMPPRNP